MDVSVRDLCPGEIKTDRPNSILILIYHELVVRCTPEAVKLPSPKGQRPKSSRRRLV